MFKNPYEKNGKKHVFWKYIKIILNRICFPSNFILEYLFRDLTWSADRVVKFFYIYPESDKKLGFFILLWETSSKKTYSEKLKLNHFLCVNRHLLKIAGKNHIRRFLKNILCFRQSSERNINKVKILNSSTFSLNKVDF